MRGLAITLLLLFPFAGTAQKLVYVDQKAGGVQTGQNWVDAFADLQQALATAENGDTIWVAAGIYKPTDTDDRTISFVLVDGVQLYGGFSGTETKVTQRDPELHPTVLSGDIGLPGVRTDNSYHVVRGKGLSENTVLDGFYVHDGYSYNEFTPIALDRYGAGLLLEGAPGVPDSRPLIQRCVFENNQGYYGGALCAIWNDPDKPQQGQNPINPVLRDCVFSRNRATNDGCAFYKIGNSAQSTFIIERCRFSDNRTFIGEGGGICFSSTASSNIIIRSCVFDHDSAYASLGGGIYIPTDLTDTTNINILFDSCSFYENISLEGGAFLFDGYTTTGPAVNINCELTNCQFEGNVARSSNGSAFEFFFAENQGTINVNIESCFFKNNNSSSDYTTLISTSTNIISKLSVYNSTFIENNDLDSPIAACFAIGHGGGRYNTITTEVTNCLFQGNGGGIASLSQAMNYTTLKIANCTFFDNNKYIFTKTWDTLFNQPNGYYNEVFIDNCIIWEPGTDLRKMFYNNEPQTSNMYGFHINHTLLNLSDSTSVPGSVKAFGEGLIWGQFPGFQDSLAGDFRLLPCSPAVNRGNNQIVLENGLLTDIDGQPRIRYGRVDLGAYEQQDSCIAINTSESQNQFEIRMWPNPSAAGILYVDLPVEISAGEIHIQVFNVQGQEVFYTTNQDIRSLTLFLDDLPVGLYVVMVRYSNKEWTEKWLRL